MTEHWLAKHLCGAKLVRILAMIFVDAVAEPCADDAAGNCHARWQDYLVFVVALAFADARIFVDYLALAHEVTGLAAEVALAGLVEWQSHHSWHACVRRTRLSAD